MKCRIGRRQIPSINGQNATDDTAARNDVRTMAKRRYPVLVETSQGRARAGLSVHGNAVPVDVSLLLRERGWTAYRIRFDHASLAWIATVMDWKQAA